ncbi:D-alanyl-D-alanine carboxypeptidase [Oceaniferula spumae]|uniref:D-alanyl-D-alanine carboxypeptidase n=1 Tax=Oceaniferula spumae TaxID=2979115 RepID=A0AAT9FI65_9BACT
MKMMINVAVLVGWLASFSASAAEPDFTPVRGLLKRVVAEGKVAGGSVLVLHGGKVVFAEGFGFADRKSKTAFQVNTPVVVASISKPLLGTAAFRLTQKGKLDLSEPVSTYLPEFENAKLVSGAKLQRSPSMIELLSHTSGLRPAEAPGGRPWFSDFTKGKKLPAVVYHYALEFPFYAPPGTRYAYSGIGTDVAARVLEVTSRQSRNALFVAEVAKPLGMTQTFYRDAESVKSIGQMPTRYYLGKDKTLQVSRKRYMPKQGDYSSSGGTIISTAPDLAKWLLMIRNDGKHEGGVFLKPEVMAKMLTKAPRSSNAQGGLFIRKKDTNGKVLVVGHSGSSGTNCWIDFKHDIIGIMLTQTRGKDIKPFRIELEKRIQQCLVSRAAGKVLTK